MDGGTEISNYTHGLINKIDVRSIDEEKRTVEFIAATENGVDTWSGRQYLRMSGIRLQRYRKNPVVLDAHNNYEAGAVIGSADVKVQDKQLIARVTFATTIRAEEIWQLIKGKFLRGLSIGYIPDRSKTTTLASGESEGEGDEQINGPAEIVRQWELYEISVVPVPADAEALRRNQNKQVLTSLEARLADIIERLNVGAERNFDMSEDKKIEKTEITPTKTDVGPLPEDRSMVAEQQRAATIRAIAPAACKDIAEICVLEGLNIDDSRKRMLEHLAKQTKPVGTPEPNQPESKITKLPEKHKGLMEMSNDEFKHALLG